MIIDQKGKLFGKISIIDLLVLIVILVGILGSVLVVRKIGNGSVLTENKALLWRDDTIDTLEVRMRLNEVRSMTRDAIHIGDDVYMDETDKYLGEIADVEVEPATRIITGFGGEAREAEVPERMDVIMILRVPGKKTDDGFYTANNIHLVYGSEFVIKTPTLQTTPVIEGIVVAEKPDEQNAGKGE